MLVRDFMTSGASHVKQELSNAAIWHVSQHRDDRDGQNKRGGGAGGTHHHERPPPLQDPCGGCHRIVAGGLMMAGMVRVRTKEEHTMP